MYNVIFAELSWNAWDKCKTDEGIMIFSQILGQFIMKFGGDCFEFGAWSDGSWGELYIHYQELHEL